MGKTGRWLRNFLLTKKDNKEKEKESKSSESDRYNNGYEHRPATPKEKRRWSFRRQKEVCSLDNAGAAVDHPEVEKDSKKHLPVTVATAVTDMEVAEEAAAVKIQSAFRAYLARKALNALKGLVQLQALVRGHLVRKQATATLRCMQALVTIQARSLAQRMRMAREIKQIDRIPLYYNHRKSTHENSLGNANQNSESCPEENIKIVEMDLGCYKPVIKARSSYSNHIQSYRTTEHTRTSKQIENHQFFPTQSAITDRTCSNHFEEFSLATAKSSPQCHSVPSKPYPSRMTFFYPRSDYAESLYNEDPFYPNYMANTESSRAKVRSHSAPKQRPIEPFDRQPGRHRPSIEGRNVPRAVRMQRSSSHVGSDAQSYQYPGSVKLDRSLISLKDSECGSNCTMITNTDYCRSLVESS